VDTYERPTRPEWPSPAYLRRHFRSHARRLRIRTVEAFDASARETIEHGRYFEYRDLRSNEPRVGYYDPETERFTALSDDESTILSHYRCPEQYVAESLAGSTYA
jgi:hypothetical protein